MNTTLLYIILAVLFTLLIVILLTPKEVRVEYVKEVPYPNYYAIWPSPYYRDWTGARSGGWYPPRHSGGHRTTYGMGSGWSSGGSHHGGGGGHH
jgi:hypothetical protein